MAIRYGLLLALASGQWVRGQCPDGFTNIWGEQQIIDNSLYGDCIKILPPMSFSNAEMQCETIYSGHLARIESKKYNKKIAFMAPIRSDNTREHLWVAYAERSTPGQWVDRFGASAPYTNWGTTAAGTSNPDNRIRDGWEEQNCVYLPCGCEINLQFFI